MVEDIPRQGLAARPGKGPKRWRQANLGQGLFRHLPDRGDLVGQAQVELWRMGRAP